MAVKKTDAIDRLAKVGPKASAAARDGKAARPDGLSVGDVAQRLGITKAEVRALLQRPEFAARTKTRIAAPGETIPPGRGVLVPEDLLADLRDTLPPKQPELVAEPSPAQPEDAEPERGTYPNPPGPEMSLAIVYERLLAEKDERISDLRAEIEHLRGILEREQSSHARTQTLLSLQAPPPAPEIEPSEPSESVEQTAPEEPDELREAPAPQEAPDLAPDPPPTEVPILTPAAKAEQIVQATSKRPFWQFWKRD